MFLNHNQLKERNGGGGIRSISVFMARITLWIVVILKKMGKTWGRGKFHFRHVRYEMTARRTCRCRCSETGKTYVQKGDKGWRLEWELSVFRW